MRKKLMAIGLCAVMPISMFSFPAFAESTTEAESTQQEETSETGGGLDSMFPLKEKVTLTCFSTINGAMKATMDDYNSCEFFKELEKRTNVHIEWNHNATNEAYALMLAGGDLPDLINWRFSDGRELIDDGILLDLTEMMPEYSPNYYSWLQDNPDYAANWALDDGTLFQYTCFNADWENHKIKQFWLNGPQYRKDWLDALGLEIPTTTDELYDVLVAIRDNDCNGNGDTTDEIPMYFGGSQKELNETMYTLAGAFGVRKDFQLFDGELIYGPVTDNYKEFLKYMNKLYTEGLINSDFAAITTEGYNPVMQNVAASTISGIGSGLTATHQLLEEQNPDYNYVSGPILKGPEGKCSYVFDLGGAGRSTGITTACKNPEIAMAWLDYAYSYAGSILATFGQEGTSYEMIDGYPTLTDEIKTSDNNWTEEECMARYIIGPISYPNARDSRFYEQINLKEDYQKETQENWGKADLNIILPVMNFTQEESDINSKYITDVTTYVDECTTKFITGDMSIDDDWDEYVSNVNSMHLDDLIKCRESAYARSQTK